ncbi:MAG: DUF47 family protein [Hydrogenovibrio sp.]|nr:DUF47 family protein [Hydrogenovibrio sp.]
MLKSLLQKYILPKETDFLTGMQQHAESIKKITQDLHDCFINGDESSCQAIIDDQHRAQEIKEANMNELLNSFITPIDRESIFRVISQLDWLAVSIRHFIIEAKAYEIKTLHNGYGVIFFQLTQSANYLAEGFNKLGTKQSQQVAVDAQQVRDSYELLVEMYVEKMAILSKHNNLQEMFVQRELLQQLKEIGKRFQVCANSLEDIVVKMD